MNVEDALQMCSAPSPDFTGGEWCYAANTLAEEVQRLTDERNEYAERLQWLRDLREREGSWGEPYERAMLGHKLSAAQDTAVFHAERRQDAEAEVARLREERDAAIEDARSWKAQAQHNRNQWWAAEAERVRLVAERDEALQANEGKANLILHDALIARADRYEKALAFYAALDPDEVPYRWTANDDPDIGWVARAALAGEDA